MPIYIFGTMVIILLISCRSQKNVVDLTRQETMLTERSETVSVFATGHAFKTLKVKRMNVEFVVNGLSDNFKGNMAVSRDSLIAISVIPMIGYEALRIMCTEDSIIVINRTEKTYHASSLDYYLEKYNLPARFNDLQAVLINEAFFYKDGYADRRYAKEIKTENGRIMYKIESIKGGKRMTNQQIAADSVYQQINDVYIDDYQRNVQMDIGYADFNVSEIEPFPKRISINIQDGNNSIKLEIKYSLVVFDDPINVKFEIPANYSRIHM